MSNKKLFPSQGLSSFKSLNNVNLEIVFHNNLKSIDVPICLFRNFVSYNDFTIINQIKEIKKIKGLFVSIDKLPFKLPVDEDSCYLLKNNSNDLGRKVRYTTLQDVMNFSENINQIIKMEFNNADSHRIFAYLDMDKNQFKILFLDPYHHVAIGADSRQKLEFPYEKCKNKTIDISTVNI